MHYGDLSDSMNMCQVVLRKVGIKGKGKAYAIKRRENAELQKFRTSVRATDIGYEKKNILN